MFSVYQTDVIVYGNNLVEYLAREFRNTLPPLVPPTDRLHVPGWSELAWGAENEDL